ncbi:hypothetical protein Pfo_029529, partial [Paulownia fortunei]
MLYMFFGYFIPWIWKCEFCFQSSENPQLLKKYFTSWWNNFDHSIIVKQISDDISHYQKSFEQEKENKLDSAMDAFIKAASEINPGQSSKEFKKFLKKIMKKTSSSEDEDGMSISSTEDLLNQNEDMEDQMEYLHLYGENELSSAKGK